jgi:GT2 family glycosyltransferase
VVKKKRGGAFHLKSAKILRDAHVDDRMSEKFPLVSIIILSYNGVKYLGNCLKSVLATDYPNYEVILVDNASTDGSLTLIEYLFKHEPRLTIIRNTKNVGFSEGNNIGIRKAKGRYIVFLNNDTEVKPDWLIELVRTMEKDRSIGAAQSKLLQLADRRRIDSVGDSIDYFGATYMRGNGEIDAGQYDNNKEIFSARGAAMIVRRSVLNEVGVFDPLFFMRCEDIDLSWRIRLGGYKVFFVPTSIVYHAGGYATLKIPSLEVLFHSTKNEIMMLLKNYSLVNFVKFNPLPIILGSIFLDLFVRKNISYAFARCKAVLWVLRNLRQIWRNRQIIQQRIRKVSDSDVMMHMIKATYVQYFKLFLSRINQRA